METLVQLAMYRSATVLQAVSPYEPKSLLYTPTFGAEQADSVAVSEAPCVSQSAAWLPVEAMLWVLGPFFLMLVPCVCTDRKSVV